MRFHYCVCAIALVACTNTQAPAPSTSTSTVGSSTSPSTSTSTSTSTSMGTSTGTAIGTELGKPAPDFTLPDVDGKSVSLAQLKGKTVVLEWFNPRCPFVKRNHELGPLKDMAVRVQKQGIVWLSINSGAPGREGYGVEANKMGIQKYAMKNPVLLDEDGKVGRAYGALHTPHMFVIDAKGNVAYRGAIDNAPDGDTDLGAPFVNYVDAALADLAANKPVAKPDTPAYGCSVKYAH